MVEAKFEPIKALREELQGIEEIRKTLASEVRRAENDYSQAETHYNNLVKLHGFAEAEITRKRAVLKQLEDERDAVK